MPELKDTNMDWLEIKDGKAIRDEINRWIVQEHTLVSSRMGWLLSINAFLFTPLAILLAKTSDETTKLSADSRDLVFLLCVMGLCVSIALAIPVFLAVHTIQVLRQRYTAFLKYEAVANAKHFHFVDPDAALDGWPNRYSCSHWLSMACQLTIPVIIFTAWLYFTLSFVCRNNLAGIVSVS